MEVTTKEISKSLIYFNFIGFPKYYGRLVTRSKGIKKKKNEIDTQKMIWSAMGSVIGLIWQEIQFLWNYNNNIKELKDKVKDLESKEATVRKWEENSKRKGIYMGDDVSRWLENVKMEFEKANEILKHTESTQMGCLFIECPNLYSRYTLSKEAFNMTSKLKELENTNFLTFGYLAQEQIPFTSPKTFVSLNSQTEIIEDVLEALKDDSITTIGICGMPGVGKTTLVNKIVDDVRANKSFDKVVVAIVSKNPIKEVQNQLAGCLGLEWDENLSDKARQDQLYTRLNDKDEKILIILEDLWQELEPHKVGFLERERLKVLFTSRVREVCNDMSAKLFEVKILSIEEAWHLFKKTAEISHGAINEDIAREVAKECGGLPIAIKIVGTALKNKKEYAWRDALQQLKEAFAGISIRGMEDLVYSRIKWSYEYLENVHSKKLLLLCSLFPEDNEIPVEYLVMYAQGLRLFQNVKTMASARDRVHTIIDELKSCYLLVEGEDEEHVKLHSVVRDVCLSIASSGEQVYMVRHAKLKKWPQINNAFYTHISLTFDGIYSQLPSDLECQKLKFLRLIFQEEQRFIKEQCASMPEEFFKKMEELEVLELAKLNSKVPSSLKLLLNLRTLLVIECRLQGDVSVINSLNQLEILSFRHSCLEGEKMERTEGEKMERTEGEKKECTKLGNLKLKFLDLRFKKGPSITFDLVSLKRLEQLYLGKSNLQYLVDAEKMTSSGGVCLNLEKLVIEEAEKLEALCSKNLPHGSFANLREVQLRKLPALRHLRGAIQHSSLGNLTLDGEEEFPKLQYLRLESLTSFKGFGHDNEGALFKNVKLANLETLYVGDVNSIKWIVGDKMPIGSLSKLRDMQVRRCHGLLHVARSNSIKLFESLQGLHIDQCQSLEVVFNFEDLNIEGTPHVQSPLLGCLQVLELEDLNSLAHIWRMFPEGIHAFNNLRVLKAIKCYNLSYLVPPSMAKLFVGLETLVTQGSNRIRSIIETEERAISEIQSEGEEETRIKIVFPKLKHFDVDGHSRLRGLGFSEH